MVLAKRKPIQVALLFGTRPEAIKLAPVIRLLQADPKQFRTSVVVTAQHREMLDQVLEVMRIAPDVDLDIMRPKQSLARLTANSLQACEVVLKRLQPDMVLVQGDTATTLAATLAAFYQHIPIGHVEAGLRTHDLENPFPEELNRRLVSVMTAWHFAATPFGYRNLIAEGVPRSRIFITGNTVVDTLYSVLEPDFDFSECGLRFAPKEQRVVIVTAHRRENFGAPLIEICRALKTLAQRFRNVQFVFPVHRNPQVQKTVKTILLGAPQNLHRLAPMPYTPFVNLLALAELALTDSGGIQEEAPALGVPVIILRKVTERPEALAAGACLIPLKSQAIVQMTTRVLQKAHKSNPVVRCPFGDGHAAERIVHAIAWIFGHVQHRPRGFKV